jgi:hypothetical protein
LTGITSYPWSRRYRGTPWAALPGVFDIPTTAMVSSSSISRSSASVWAGMAVATTRRE